jgi:hypothetical protein
VNSSNNFPPSFELTRLYEKTSAKGTRYFSGRLAGARITLLPTEETSDDGAAIWKLLIAQAAKPQNGQARQSYAKKQYAQKRETANSDSFHNDGVADLYRNDPPPWEERR